MRTDASALTPHSDAAILPATLPIDDNNFPKYSVQYRYISCGQLLIQRKDQSRVQPPTCKPSQSPLSRSIFDWTGNMDKLDV